MVHQLSVDLETYSSVDLRKSGLYRYVQSPDFQILLFAYSLDGGPVTVVDLTVEQFLPQEVLRHMFDADTVKCAYNAPFEWYCLSKHFGLFNHDTWTPEKWLPQWRCTMLHGLYCGYPAGLAAIGAALGLPQERQKLAAGSALIRYFCLPCKPSKSNGGRVRNLPRHDPDKWTSFKAYCAQDVAVEMEVARRLAQFPVPDSVQAQWATDQIINARGIAVDEELVQGALWCGQKVRDALLAEAREVSGLDNPNSVAQLIQWLRKETGEEVDNLRKDTVADLLTTIRGAAATRILEIRQELSKTSTKKYDALEAAVGDDGRVRGLLQFYGASRTGRWAGRIVQPQNLPRTYIDALPLARDLVKAHRTDALELIYGSVPDTLSQLIRTALVAAPGRTLIDADFSAIEARVIAWLAGEEWVLEVFRTHGRIYEATASQMFGVPLEAIAKGNPEYELRQKGKVATLALGFQGSAGALKTMGALRMGLTEDELPDIVSRWRQANPRIVQLWYGVETAAIEAVRSGAPCTVRGITFARECDPAAGQDFLTARLPSGRKLYYVRPHFGTNRFGGESLLYYGMNQTSKRWESTETYGGKLVENLVQAIARDCLAEAITRLERAGYCVVLHVHDEVVVEAPADRADLQKVAAVLSEPLPWAPDLPLTADGWVNEFYKKD